MNLRNHFASVFSIHRNFDFSQNKVLLELDSSNVPYIAYRDWENSYKITVMKFNK